MFIQAVPQVLANTEASHRPSYGTLTCNNCDIIDYKTLPCNNNSVVVISCKQCVVLQNY